MVHISVSNCAGCWGFIVCLFSGHELSAGFDHIGLENLFVSAVSVIFTAFDNVGPSKGDSNSLSISKTTHLCTFSRPFTCAGLCNDDMLDPGSLYKR